MLLRFKRDKQKGIIPAILAVVIAFASIVFILLIGALLFWIHHLVAGLIGGGNQPGGFYGAGNCATTQTLEGVTLPKAKGPLSSEQHLATAAESFPSGWPTNSNDQAERHYQITNFSVNCAGCPKEGFTPAEGGGNVGGGTGAKPDPKVEPWIMNVLEDLPRNSKVIIRSTQTGKVVVAAGGYEKGPSSTKFAGGAQYEVLHALGIEHNGEVEIGYAQDQSLPFGPIQCDSSAGSTGPYTGRRTTYAGIEEALGRACDESQLVTINFMGRNVEVHKKAAPAFEAVVQDIKASNINYNFWDESKCAGMSNGGTYNCRMNINGPGQSPHSYGIAIDINPGHNIEDPNSPCNPNYRRTRRPGSCTTDIPLQVVQIFKRHGFRWGGDFRRVCDSMHFEWMNW